MSKPLIICWLAVCLIPLITLAIFVINPPEDAAQHLINGIILACEATFLFKFVLFDTIKHLSFEKVV
jgi:putative membrane protein